MSESVTMDEKGRLVLPKRVRESAGIGPKTKLVARASGAGTVELTDLAVLMAKAQATGAKKLAGWREEAHEATAYILGSMTAKDEAY